MLSISNVFITVQFHPLSLLIKQTFKQSDKKLLENTQESAPKANRIHHQPPNILIIM